jgi:hypothetical protein
MTKQASERAVGERRAHHLVQHLAKDHRLGADLADPGLSWVDERVMPGSFSQSTGLLISLTNRVPRQPVTGRDARALHSTHGCSSGGTAWLVI